MGVKIDKAVFPGLQGGPHDNVIAAIAVMLKEDSLPSFTAYAHQVVKNANVLAGALRTNGYTLTTGGTDNHLMVVDLRPQGIVGNIAALALEGAGIVVNRNSVPHDSNPPFYPSGIRLGTPAVTTRGMKEDEMKQIAVWITEVLRHILAYQLPEEKEKRGEFIRSAHDTFAHDPVLENIRRDVVKLCKQFPLGK
jgi:glycine hydroxymethyltransferase